MLGLSTLPVLLTLVAIAVSTMGLFTRKWNPKDKVRTRHADGTTLNVMIQHCYVTGGSTGLGLALAKILVKNGAHVSIVARNQENLNRAVSTLEVGYSQQRRPSD